MKISRLLPKSLKRLLIRCSAQVIALTCRRAYDDIRLSLGGVLPPAGKFVRGGKVKLIHLREHFGDYRWRFNLLYLVSSGLPSNPDLWVHTLKRAGVKVVWNQNGVAYPGWAGTSENVEQINAPMRLLQEADHVIYQSAFCKESADRWVGPAKGPWSIVPNYTEINTFSPKSRPIGRPLTLVSIGSHFTSEKILLALEALADVRAGGIDARLFLAGRFDWPGAESDVLGAISRLGLGGSVTRSGPFLRSEAPELYRKGDIFIHLKYMDPCPTAVIEAMACGLPIIGSASGGMPELVNEKAGILLPVPKDWNRLHYPSSTEIADAIRKISGTLDIYSDSARQLAVERFNEKKWIDLHERLFSKLLA